MRALCIFILCLKLVLAVEFDKEASKCTLKEPDRIEDADGICKLVVLVYSELNVTDFSGTNIYKIERMVIPFGEFITPNTLRIVNTSLEHLSIASIKAKRIEIRQNQFLKYTNAHFEAEEVRVSGNPKFTINKDVFRGYDPKKFYVQEGPECEFDNILQEFRDLPDCKNVNGDLRMENTTGSLSRIHFGYIRGCLRIINTTINTAMMGGFDTNFLSFEEKCKTGEKSEISLNKNLWIHPKTRKILEKRGNILISNHPEAVGNCTLSDFVSTEFDCTHLTGDLIINGKLKSLHNLETIKVINGIITITGSDLTKIEFPELTHINGDESKEPVLTLMDNSKLESISFPKLKSAQTGSDIFVKISNNGKLQELPVLYEQFSKLSNGKRMDIECDFAGKEISDLSQLDHCTSVKGDLFLKNTKGSTTAKLSQIGGCLKVIDTELSDLSFLTLDSKATKNCNSGSEITGNKNLCLHWPNLKKLQGTLGKIDYKPDESCELPCSLEEFEESSENACDQLIGDLTITKLDSTTMSGSPLTKVMAKVKRIKGKLTVSDNIDVSIDFPNLDVIDNSASKDEAILIEGNEKLKGFTMPKLKSVVSQGDTAVIIKGFKMEKDLTLILKNAVGDKKIEHECDLKGAEVSDFSEIDSCTEIEGNLVLKNTKGSPSTILTSISGCLKIENTELDSLSFLSLDINRPSKCASNSEISGNEKLCEPWSVVKEIKQKFGQKISYTPDEACVLPCSLEEFGEVDQIACNQFIGDLSITGLKAGNIQASPLSTIMAKVREITGTLSISGNDGVKIEFPQLEKSGAISVAGEGKLERLSMPNLKSVVSQDNVAITVTGCEITKEQAKILKIASGHRDFKLDCDTSNKPITDISQLDYCTSITGDLLLTKTTGYPTTNIESISGCLQIIDTDLTHLGFLALKSESKSDKCNSGEKSEIKGNKHLCLGWNQVKNLRKEFGKTIDFSFDEACALPCDVQEFGEEGSYCDQIDGDLEISKSSDLNVAKAIFTKLKSLNGFLSITNTTLEEIWFTKLQTINDEKSNDNSHTISVVGNNDLRELLMPNLKNITTVKPVPVFITENDKFRLPDKTKHIFEQVLGSKDKILYECHESVEINQYSRLEGCSRMSSDLHLKGEITGNRPFTHISHIKGCLKIEATSLNSLDFLDLKETGGEGCFGKHYIKDNKNLCVSPFSSREMVKMYKDLEISGNKPRIECPVFCEAVNGSIPDHECNVVEGELRIETNCSFNPDFQVIEEIRGGLVVKGCSLTSLTSILPGIQNISGSGIPLVLENIDGYSNVTDLKEFNLYSDGVLLKLSTVSKIPYMDAADLKAHFGSKRVEITNVEPPKDGVCIFVDPAIEVKNCSIVQGDLVLDETSGLVSSEIREITGCLMMSNTTLKNYEFLTKIEKVREKCRWKNAVTEISDNSCIPYNVRKSTSGKIQEKVDKENNKKECHECVGGVISGENCEIIIGNLEINESATLETAKQMEEVKEIYGRLIIKNSNLPQIKMSQLTKVEALENTEPAIEISGNKELSSLEMPSLATAKSNGKVQIKIADNKKLKKSSELVEQLGKATGTHCGEKEGACQFSQVSKPEKAKSTKEKTTEEGGFTLIPKVLVTSGCITLVIGIIAGIGFFLVKRWKDKREKGAEEKEDSKKKGKGKKTSSKKKTTKTKSTAKTEEKTKTKEEKSGSQKKTVSKEPAPDAQPEKSKEAVEQKSKDAGEQQKQDDFFSVPAAV